MRERGREILGKDSGKKWRWEGKLECQGEKRRGRERGEGGRIDIAIKD